MEKLIKHPAFILWLKEICGLLRWGTIIVEFKDGKATMVKIQEDIKL